VTRKLEPSRTDALLDMGCGAGRAICVAAQYPFSRVIGIDIDEGLCAVAERNARRLRRYAVRPEVVRADATIYHVPDDQSPTATTIGALPSEILPTLH
jgi:precorrin-6B methylase 2